MDCEIIERNYIWELDIDDLLSKRNRKRLNSFLTQDATLLLDLIYSLFVENNERNGFKYSEHMLMPFSVEYVEKKTKLSGARQFKALEALERCGLIRFYYGFGNKRKVNFLFNNVHEFFTVFYGFTKAIKHPYYYYPQLKNAFFIDDDEEEEYVPEEETKN